MKNSIQHDAVAWFSRHGTGEAIFVPMAQSSDFTLDLPRVVHKCLGQKGPLGNYRYKSPNISFTLSVCANGQWTFGSELNRNTMAYENYVSSSLSGQSLSGLGSALYYRDKQPKLDMISAYQEGYSSGEISTLSNYTGFFCKFEDCKLSSFNLTASVGKFLESKLDFLSQDVSLLRESFDYTSGINEFYEIVRPQDIFVSISAGDEYIDAQINSLDITMPIQYKTVEGFGSNKPIERKTIFPVVGTIKMESIPHQFFEMPQKWFESPDIKFSCKIFMRATKLAGGTPMLEDFLMIEIPIMYLESKTLSSSVGTRTTQSLSFSFFEYGNLSNSDFEGLFFMRKLPETVYSLFE